jgi:hypothetical protein
MKLKCFIFMYEIRALKPAEIVLRKGQRRRREGEGGEFD